MTRKEIRNFAKKIAKLELSLREATDKQDIKQIEAEIMKMCYKVASLEDMARVDEEVQDILRKNS